MNSTIITALLAAVGLFAAGAAQAQTAVDRVYLIGVKSDIETMGAGKSQAVPGVSCNDRLPKKKLVDCLAPNRRTVVEVQGPAK